MADDEKELWRVIGKMEQGLSDIRRNQEDQRQNYELGKARAIQAHEELLTEVRQGFKGFREELSVVRSIAASKMDSVDYPLMRSIEAIWRDRKVVIALLIVLAALGFIKFGPVAVKYFRHTEIKPEAMSLHPDSTLKDGGRKHDKKR